MKKYCIFACGGHGTRMGGDIPKQFLRIGDKTILQLSIERVLSAAGDIHPVVVLPPECVDFWREECGRMALGVQQSIVKGGITRFHSVRNALGRIPEDDAVVAVHDGVRPLCSEKLVAALLSAAEKFDAVVPVVPVVDTLKVLETLPDGSFRQIEGQSADRSVLFGAQTPQVFRSGVLRSAYSQPYNTAFTDDASVVQSAGVQVHYIPGERYNIKITTPEDLLFARRFSF